MNKIYMICTRTDGRQEIDQYKCRQLIFDKEAKASLEKSKWRKDSLLKK